MPAKIADTANEKQAGSGLRTMITFRSAPISRASPTAIRSARVPSAELSTAAKIWSSIFIVLLQACPQVTGSLLKPVFGTWTIGLHAGQRSACH